VALNTIENEDGEQQQIMRFNMPFGRVGAREFGTYFIGYSRRPEVIEQMLTNMFIGKPPGNYDRILDFSTAVTGNLFFVPSAAFLDDLPTPGSATPGPGDAGPAPDNPGGDGSLGIGSLHGVAS
jgi:putative iron-dependent peroxidase